MSVIDKGMWLAGKGREFPGEFEYADDYICMYLQGTTHYDALGHAWAGDQIWNGYAAATTIGGMSKASVRPLADHGIVGRGVLLDMARHRGKSALDRGETFTHTDLVDCANRQGSPLEKRDILVIRTGWVGWFYEVGPQVAFSDFREPGLVYSRELVSWFHEMEIPSVVTDTTANEIAADPVSGFQWPLHIALMSYLGITLAETAWLDDLADHCAADGQYSFLFAASPLKVNEATGAPVNPIVIK
jgi:kynurenine formamidase